MRIVTLTLNPALDLSTRTDCLEPDRKLRCEPAVLEPGGGGVNVARVAIELGADAHAVVALGGPLGELVAAQLEAARVPTEAVGIAGPTRQSFTVEEITSGRQFRFVLPGPALTSAEWEACLDATLATAASADAVVASSSLPDGVPADAFATLAHRLDGHGPRVLVDTSGDALVAAIGAPVDVVKPSANELRSIAGQDLRRESDYETAARELLEGGRCRAIVVSLGAAGALVVAREHDSFVVHAPAVQVVSAVGAGDSMVAAMAVALGEGLPLVEAVRRGVAAGTAAVTTPGTELCRRADLEALLPWVTVGDVPGHRRGPEGAHRWPREPLQ